MNHATQDSAVLLCPVLLCELQCRCLIIACKVSLNEAFMCLLGAPMCTALSLLRIMYLLMNDERMKFDCMADIHILNFHNVQPCMCSLG